MPERKRGELLYSALGWMLYCTPTVPTMVCNLFQHADSNLTLLIYSVFQNLLYLLISVYNDVALQFFSIKMQVLVILKFWSAQISLFHRPGMLPNPRTHSHASHNPALPCSFHKKTWHQLDLGGIPALNLSLDVSWDWDIKIHLCW